MFSGCIYAEKLSFIGFVIVDLMIFPISMKIEKKQVVEKETAFFESGRYNLQASGGLCGSQVYIHFFFWYLVPEFMITWFEIGYLFFSLHTYVYIYITYLPPPL